MTIKDIPRRVHFVGIGGVSMSALAQHLHTLGHTVTGSDREQSAFTDILQALGIDVTIGCCKELCADLIVKTSAVSDVHQEIVLAKKLGIPVLLREELLGIVFNGYPTRIAVCGTHGKTTVTAMISHVLNRCNVEHTAFVGGRYNGQNYRYGKGIVIAEACEYNRSFLHLKPTVCVCLNAEFDHPDCYRNKAQVEKAFRRLFGLSQKIIAPKELKKLCKKATLYDEKFTAKNLYFTNGKPTFDLYLEGQLVGRCHLQVLGRHNVENAIATICLCHKLHLPLLQVLQALSTFDGVERRWTEKLGPFKIVCDYAHHPTEISTAIQTARLVTKGKLLCMFQPHTYSRTKAFWKDFAKCFEGVKVCYLPIYPAREIPIEGVSSQSLSSYAKSIGVDSSHLATFEEAKVFAQNTLGKEDTLLLLGAGNIARLAEQFS